MLDFPAWIFMAMVVSPIPWNKVRLPGPQAIVVLLALVSVVDLLHGARFPIHV